MKKSLVLAMAMALGVTASAYAANPFSDVPAGHWAYDSISKLAAAGVIEGYGDDTFRGDRLMTRYEMAQIVAKAMAKGANVDKLAAEFADELDALGVRVAALEKKSDNVKITGEFRYHYEDIKADGHKGHTNVLRSRLWFTGKVNDNWDYVGMLENQQDLKDNAGNEDTAFQRAYLQGRLGGAKVVAGRLQKTLFDSMVYGSRMDGIDVSYGDKVKLNVYYGKSTNANASVIGKPDRMYGVGVVADLGKNISLHAGYDHFKNTKKDTDDTNKVINAGLDFKFGKDVKFGATYLHTDDDTKVEGASNNGYLLSLGYKGANKAKVGSWGLGVKYYHTPAGISVANGWDTSKAVYFKDDENNVWANFYNQGFKGWAAEAKVTVAKNMIAGVEYWDFKGREDDVKAKTLWTEFKVFF